MSTRLPHRLSDKEAESIIQVLETADEYHLHWLRDLHTSLICAAPFAANVLAEHSHELCRFGQWYSSESPASLHEDNDFIELGCIHEQMHDSARLVACKYVEQQAIEIDEYHDFIQHQQRLSNSISCLRDRLQKLRFSFDSLTGAVNREAFFSMLHKEYARLQRTGEPCAIALVDLDFFKAVNDTYGHLAGDRVLRWTSRQLFRGLRKYDAVCRYGGEEFLLFLPQVTGLQALEILERVRQELAHTPVKMDEHDIVVTASFGISMLTQQRSIQDSVERADQALYQAKEKGRNRVVFLE